MRKYVNKRNLKNSALLSACLIGSMIFMSGCSGKGGSGDGGGDLTSCSVPIEASLSDGLDRIGGCDDKCQTGQ